MIPVLILAAHLGVAVWDYIGVNATLCVLPDSYCQTVSTVGNQALYSFNGLPVIYVQNEWRVAVEGDAPAPTVSRKFAGVFLPSHMPRFAYLPVVTEAELARIGPVGDPVFLKQPFSVFQVLSGGMAYQYLGQITASGYAFIVDRYDFGGDLGVQNNVLGIEHLSGITGNTENGIRYERYLYVKGYGMAYAGGWEDANCRAGISCTGTYTNPVPGGFALPYIKR